MKLKDYEVRKLRRVLEDAGAPKAFEAVSNPDIDVVLLTQAAFGTTAKETKALGAMVKLAGHFGKEIHIIPHPAGAP